MTTATPATAPAATIDTDIEQSSDKIGDSIKAGVKYTSYKISVNANEKLNMGDYTSAERGLFLSREVLIPEGVSEEEGFKILQDETRKLQFMAEAQLKAIIMHHMAAMKENSGYARTWFELAKAGWNNFANKARMLYGAPSLEEEAAAKLRAGAAPKTA